uniref:BAHD acyltransferase BIA1-like n=2 Tax=Cicer arietinum TaxID=3827 RepID=A0A1S2XB67_CICAR|nr:BAHD acyltransferase BIA1-like [Cicer arietinum]
MKDNQVTVNTTKMMKQNERTSSSNCEVKLETLNRVLIKPSKPTPPNLQTFKLSLLDQLSPNFHGNTTFFYPNYNNINHSSHFLEKSKLLQNSLSQTLTLFYPLAGNLQDAATINCNDGGVFFIESQTNTTLSEILTNPDFDTFECFLPSTDEKQILNLLLIRFTLFDCGSTAITVSLTHKIADFNTLITFLKTWTAVCGGDTKILPDLTTAVNLFPPREFPAISASVKTSNKKITSRRFIFEASKIEELKTRVKRTVEFNPTRVEVVLALIWKCALSTTATKTTSFFKHSILLQAVNLRTRMEPTIPENAVGNLIWPFSVTVEDECHVAIDEMVKRMRKGMREFIESKVERFKEEGWFEFVMESLKERVKINEGSLVIYRSSSWCNFPLLENDFGWGKPVWSCSVNKVVSNTIALMDTKDGCGVEAFVTLDEDHMEFFQQDQELLNYAMLNPRIII